MPTHKFSDPDLDDQSLDPVADVRASTGDFLSELTDALSAEVHKPDVTYGVSTRKNVSLRYDVNIDAHSIERWQRSAVRKVNGKATDDVDAIKFAVTVIWNTNNAIILNGRHDGEMTIRDNAVREMVGAMDTTSTVRRFFGDDAVLIAHSRAVLDAAGYSEDGMTLVQDEEDDPLA